MNNRFEFNAFLWYNILAKLLEQRRRNHENNRRINYTCGG